MQALHYQCKQVQVHVTETGMHGSVFMITASVDHARNTCGHVLLYCEQHFLTSLLP